MVPAASVAQPLPHAALVNRQPAEAVLAEGCRVAVELGIAVGTDEWPAEIPHDFGVGVEGSECVAVGLAPASQGQARRVQDRLAGRHRLDRPMTRPALAGLGRALWVSQSASRRSPTGTGQGPERRVS